MVCFFDIKGILLLGDGGDIGSQKAACNTHISGSSLAFDSSHLYFAFRLLHI